MRLLSISTSCFSSTNREFYRRLNSDKEIEVCIIVPKHWDFGSGLKEAEPAKKEDPDIKFLEPTNTHHRLFRLKGLRACIEEFKPDFIYYEGDPGSVMAASVGKICSSHNIQFSALSCENLSQHPIAVVKREGIGQFINACIKYALTLYSRRHIDTLFVINNAGLSYFNKLRFKNVVKTPLGFNENVFQVDNQKRLATRKKLGINEQTIVIAYYGRLVYEKGVHVLIEALGKLKFNNWVLLIDEFSRYKTDYQAKVESLIREHNIKDKTIFFEADHTEIAQYMNASDLTVLASVPTKKWVEQYGRVVPEALACGNLVIISNQGAQQEFFDPNYAYKFSPHDSNQLASLIEKASMEVNENYNREEISIQTINQLSLTAQLKLFKKAIA